MISEYSKKALANGYRASKWEAFDEGHGYKMSDFARAQQKARRQNTADMNSDWKARLAR